MKLPIKPIAPLRMEPNLFGPDRPVYPVSWAKAGNALRVAREDRGLSLAGAAARLGLEPEDLHRLEAGGYEFSLADAKAMLWGGDA